MKNVVSAAFANSRLRPLREMAFGFFSVGAKRRMQDSRKEREERETGCLSGGHLDEILDSIG